MTRWFLKPVNQPRGCRRADPTRGGSETLLRVRALAWRRTVAPGGGVERAHLTAGEQGRSGPFARAEHRTSGEQVAAVFHLFPSREKK